MEEPYPYLSPSSSLDLVPHCNLFLHWCSCLQCDSTWMISNTQSISLYGLWHASSCNIQAMWLASNTVLLYYIYMAGSCHGWLPIRSTQWHDYGILIRLPDFLNRSRCCSHQFLPLVPRMWYSLGGMDTGHPSPLSSVNLTLLIVIGCTS